MQAKTHFTEEAMRERAPYLHWQYIGQYRPPGEGMPPGEGGPDGELELGGSAVTLSSSIMRHQDELALRVRAQHEREQLEMAEEETESDEDEEAMGCHGAQRRGATAAAWLDPGMEQEMGEAGTEDAEEEDAQQYVPLSEEER
jgi:hypothetical protein